MFWDACPLLNSKADTRILIGTMLKFLDVRIKKDSRLFLESSFTYGNDNSINRCVDMLDQYKITINSILRKIPNSSGFSVFLNFGCFLN